MELGFSTMNTPEEVPAPTLAVALEERGYESFWIGEHPHIPTSRLTPYPAGGEMPSQYRRMMDPYIALAAAAQATERLTLGLGVSLPLEHDIFALAKQIATMDVLSGGRILFGVGVGWNEEELANHRPDIPWRMRYRALEECVEALRRLWCDDESEFHGTWFDFDPVWCLPKPISSPHPPILCGTGGKLGTQHAVRWADGWAPMDVALGNVAKKIGLFREALIAADRDPETVPITIVTFGDPTLETLQHYASLGVVRTVVGASREGWDDPTTTMPFVDRYAAMIPELR